MNLLQIELNESTRLSLTKDDGWKLDLATLDGMVEISSYEEIKNRVTNLAKIAKIQADKSIYNNISMYCGLVTSFANYYDMRYSISDKLREIKQRFGINYIGVDPIHGILLSLIGGDSNVFYENTLSHLQEEICKDLDIEEQYHNGYTDITLALQLEIDALRSSDRGGHINNSFEKDANILNYDKTDKIIDMLQLIPSTGKCNTLLGELFRLGQRVIYRFWNDGDIGDYYQDGNFIDTCNMMDFIYYSKLPKDKKEIIDCMLAKGELVNSNLPSGIHVDYFKLWELEETPYKAALIWSEGWYQYMIDYLIEADEDILNALKTKDVDYLNNNLKLGVNLKFKVDYYEYLLAPGNKVDFRSKLYFSVDNGLQYI